ncbi:MAG: hypothetical protein QXM81_01930 [Nitrososphaerota archaeon]|nr:hypothetical protein [Candidatus Calditenuis fumarioli]
MVRFARICGTGDYVCEECGTAYHDLETARRCEDFCRTHHACSLEIIRHAAHQPSEVPSTGS